MDFNKSYFTVADLQKILGLEKETLYVTLSRLTKSGILKRLRKNVYKAFPENCDEEKIANELYYPSYLSFEKALSNFGILSQIPLTVTFATTRPSNKLKIANTEIEYSHLNPDLFFGYELKDGKYTAVPEKAILDQLYMVSKGFRSINIEELDLRDIKEDKINEYAKRFPSYIKPLVNQVKKYIGTTPVTNENKERIRWGK